MSWSSAYARQAKSDLEARDQLLANPKLPQCHQLHYLQMAAEKLCKAYLAGQGTPSEKLKESHAFIAGPLMVIARIHFARETRHKPKEGWRVEQIKTLARQIERLHPSIDKAATPANCEYPWIGPDGTILAPAEYNRFGLDLLHSQAGTTLLKIMREAAEELSREVDRDGPSSQS